ncbi:MAG: hypothetical protein R3E66_14735 [bacterium]
MFRFILPLLLSVVSASANAEPYKVLDVSGQIGVGGDTSANFRYWVSPDPNTDAQNEPIPFVRDYRQGADRVSSMDLTLMDVGKLGR